MKRRMFGVTISLLVVSSLMLFRCGLPDPFEPSKTSIAVVFKNSDSVVFGNTITDTVGKPLSIGAVLYLPENFDSISLRIKENDIVKLDTMLKTINDDYLYDTVWCPMTFSSEGLKTVTLTPFSNPTLQALTTNVAIYERPVITTVHITFAKNSTSATGSMPVQTCTSGVSFQLSKNSFVNSGYRFAGWATSPSGSVQYKDENEIQLSAEDLLLYAVWVDPNSIAPAIVHAPSQLIAGKADTLLFAVDNGSRPDPLTISLLTNLPLDPAVFSIVPSGADSIRIAVSKSAGPTTTTIGIITSNGNKSDTAKYTITLISPDAAIWNTTSVDQNAIEGSAFKLDLSQYLPAVNGSGVSLSADIGTIDQTTWSYTPKWGSAATIPATITARKDELALTLTINLTITAGDTVKPRLSLIDPLLDGKMVSSEQITVECKATDSGAGIDSVVFTCGTKTVTGTLQGEDVYSGVITGLVNNTPVQVTVTATDKSQKRNSTTLTFSVTRDSTILDAEQPVIVKVAGPECGSRVKEATGSLTFTVNDNSGVDSVWWTLNDAFVAVVATSGESEYAVNYTLINYGNNVIRLFAKDKSAAGNKGSQTITLTYNTEVSALTLTAPAVNATGVSTSPTFKWSGGDDEDGDGVTYSVNYGISQASLTGTATVTGKTATPGTPLAYAKTYYWQVTATSASTAFPDKVQSAVGTFTTDGSLPTISAQPLSTSVEEGQSVAFSVTADGFGTLSYQWQKNNSPINGATSSSYKISAVPMAMNNNSYVCVVRNEVGEVTSNAAKLTVIAKYKVTYNENYGAQYVPVDDKRYGAGEEVTVKAADSRMVKDGHKFIGWCLNYNGNGTMLNTGDRFKMGSQDTVLFAQWEVIKYVVTFKNNVNNDSKNQSYDAGTSLLSNQYPSFDITGYEFSYWDKSSITVNSPTTITAYYIPTDCEASGNDIQICSGSGETYDLIITAKNSACTIMEYVWYQHHGTFEFITDGDFGGLFTAHGQSKSTLVVSNVEGVAYGFACIVKFLNGQKDTVFFPVQLCNQ